MDDVRTMQGLIATKAGLSTESGFQMDVDIKWFGTSAPLIVPDKVRGEWRLLNSCPVQGGSWRLHYVYHSPPTQWRIMVKTCGGYVELADSRSYDHTALIEAMGHLDQGFEDTRMRFRAVEVPL